MDVGILKTPSAYFTQNYTVNMILKTTLQNDIIFLRTLETRDGTEKYLTWLRNPVINEFLETRYKIPSNVGEIIKFINYCNNSETLLLLGIFKVSSSLHIGNIKLTINKIQQSADVGYLIGDENEWGNGYASSAILLTVNLAFRDLGILKITAGCNAKNVASMRALQKAGFVEEGRKRKEVWFKNERSDVVIFGIVNPTSFDC